MEVTVTAQTRKGWKEIGVSAVCLAANIYVGIPAALTITNALEATAMFVVVIFAGGVACLLFATGVLDVLQGRSQ
jgi:hypothetical protein